MRIPPGIDEGRALRIAGHGHPSPEQGGPSGDLYVFVHSDPDPRFQRHGPHLRYTAKVPIPDAVLGTHLQVSTLEDQVVEIKIPPGTQSDAVFRVRGQGLPILGTGERGNLYVIVQVQIPEQLNQQQRELYEQLRAVEPQCAAVD